MNEQTPLPLPVAANNELPIAPAHLDVLQALYRVRPLVLKNADVAAALGCDRERAGKLLAHLRAGELVARPLGPHGGHVITTSGVAVLVRFRPAEVARIDERQGAA